MKTQYPPSHGTLRSALCRDFVLSPHSPSAQNLTLEGQTGGFITPTAYVVYSAKDKFFSHPAVGYHFVDASNVIGNIHTFSIAEGFANRAEVGYTRSEHTEGNSAAFSSLWHYAGMNIFNGKVVAIKDGQFGPWTPGSARGLWCAPGQVCERRAEPGAYRVLEVATPTKTCTWRRRRRGCIRRCRFWSTSAGRRPMHRSMASAARQRVLADGCSADWAFRCRRRSRRPLCRRSDLRRSRRK